MLLDEVVVLNLEMERIPWAMGLDQEKLVLRTIYSHPNPSFHSIKCIRLCYLYWWLCLPCQQPYYLPKGGSIASWATVVSGAGPG
uniref:Uncharacterized protein n=1 Tax=Picea glauca TaxID=3330 RepID=A0A101LVX1_PICGL|nr:hypothetical protein ABT39_MTgene1837 [Picea glauca]